jgi:signal transduction histidine kinase
VTLRADPQRLAQVLHNLLDNAARYAPDGSVVDVVAVVDGDHAQLRVRDRGPGVPEDEMATIFERFVQGQRRDQRGAGGTGLGLAIVRTLVGLHGGSVAARNLPVAERRRRRVHGDAAAAGPRSARTPDVLSAGDAGAARRFTGRSCANALRTNGERRPHAVPPS